MLTSFLNRTDGLHFKLKFGKDAVAAAVAIEIRRDEARDFVDPLWSRALRPCADYSNSSDKVHSLFVGVVEIMSFIRSFSPGTNGR